MARKHKARRKAKKSPYRRKERQAAINLRMEGRHIIMSSRFTSAEWMKHLNQLEQQAHDLPKDINQLVTELRESMKRLPTLQLLSNLTAAVLFHSPEEYKEYEQKPWIMLEYPTWLCLLEPYPTVKMHFIDGPEMEQILGLLEKLLINVQWHSGLDYLRQGRTKPTAVDEIVHHAKMYHLNVRAPGYWDHEKEINRHLFSPYDVELRNTLGFGIQDAHKMIDTIGIQIENAIHERLQKARETETEWLQLVTEYKKTGKTPSGMPDYLQTLSQTLSLSELQEHLRNAAIAWCWFGMEDALTVEPHSIAQAANVSLDTAIAFLERFSLSFGQKPIADCWPSRYELLETSPLVALSDAKYFAHLATKLIWAIRPNLESAIKKKPELWEDYQKHRATYLEKETLRLLRGVLPGATAYHKLRYTMPNEEGVETEYELDGIILYDKALILVESKAGAMSPAARRGAPSFTEDLQELIVHAQEQCLRAKAYIDMTPQPRFFSSNGTAVDLHKDDFSRILLVSSTLDDLTAFALKAASLRTMGTLRRGELPWVIRLSDLRVISEILEFGPQLIHYLERRKGLDTESITSHDELDFFGHYLKFGLDFGKEKARGATRIVLLTHTTDFDDYYLYIMGERKTPAPKPKQDLPPDIRKQLAELVNEGTSGFVDEACSLLDSWKPES
jgi:hypothetical protein